MEHAEKQRPSSKNPTHKLAAPFESFEQEAALREAVVHPSANTLTPDVVRRLQRTHGNAFVQRLVATQPKPKAREKQSDEHQAFGGESLSDTNATLIQRNDETEAGVARRRETTIQVQWTDDSTEFYHRVVNATSRNPAFRGVPQHALWQNFLDPSNSFHRRHSQRHPLDLTEGTRVGLHVGANYDPDGEWVATDVEIYHDEDRPAPIPVPPVPVPVPTPTPQTGLTFTPCATLPHSLGSRGACGVGTDFTYHDFPSLSWGNELLVTPYRLRPNFDLGTEMAAVLGGLAGSEGIGAYSHFAGGSGSKRTHGVGSTLSTLTNGCGSFATLLADVQRLIKAQITAQAATGAINCATLNIPGSSMPTISFSFSDGATLKAVIGGTHGMEIQMTSMTLDPTTRTYTMGLRFIICDNFGVDDNDLYAPGLIPFWVLQHERSGYVPFINEIIVEPSIHDTF